MIFVYINAFLGVYLQSTVRKKMAAVHFPQYLANLTESLAHLESHILANFHPCTNTIVYARFEVFRPFLRVLMVFLDITFDLQTGARMLNAVLAFPTLTCMSRSDPLSQLIFLLRYTKSSTSSISSPSSSILPFFDLYKMAK